jgi:precorrin-6B methylase 2
MPIRYSEMKSKIYMVAASLIMVLLFKGNSICAQEKYTYRKADPEGTGKWYFGREIAPVMSHYGIGWLERSEREEEEHSGLLLKNMQLKPGDVVADIGAGSGYHVIRMSPIVGPMGKVIAVDIQQEMLDYIVGRTHDLKFRNVEIVLGTEKSVKLKAGSIDKMLLVDVYHEFEFPAEMGQSMWKALKPGGLIYLIEYRAEDSEVPIKRVHKMTARQAIAEMEAAGFRFVRNMDNLPWQHCLIFARPQ